MDNIKVNDIIKVVVTGIQKYGAFVLIDDKYDGLIHISEISSGSGHECDGAKNARCGYRCRLRSAQKRRRRSSKKRRCG